MLFRPREKPSISQRVRSVLWPRGGPQRGWLYLVHRLRRLAGSPHAIAIGFAAGVFASITPFVGFQFALAALLAALVGGSVVASAIGTFFANPLTYPLIWYTTYDFGGMLLGREAREPVDLTFKEGTLALMVRDPMAFMRQFWDMAEPVIWPMTVGSVPVGLAVAVLSYFLVRAAVAAHHRRRLARPGVRSAGGGSG